MWKTLTEGHIKFFFVIISEGGGLNLKPVKPLKYGPVRRWICAFGSVTWATQYSLLPQYADHGVIHPTDMVSGKWPGVATLCSAVASRLDCTATRLPQTPVIKQQNVHAIPQTITIHITIHYYIPWPRTMWGLTFDNMKTKQVLQNLWVANVLYSPEIEHWCKLVAKRIVYKHLLRKPVISTWISTEVT